MKKGLIWSAIVLWTVIAATFICLCVYGVNNGFDIFGEENTLLKSENIQLNNVQNIIIEGTHQGIELRKTNGDIVKISQYSSSKTKDTQFIVSQDDGSIKIYFEKVNNFSFMFKIHAYDRLVIEIPESFIGNLDVGTTSGGIKTEDDFTFNNIKMHTSSGGIHINKKLTADKIDLDVTSGGIKISDCVTAKEIDAETSSGGIHINEKLVADKLELSATSGGINIRNSIDAKEISAVTSSGGIKLETVITEKYHLKSTSGGIKVGSITGSGEMTATSGGITAALTDPRGEVRFVTSSGGIKLSLESSLEFTLDASTSSGGIHTNFSIEKNEKGNHATARIGENPIVNIIAKATSGGVKIEN